MRGGVRVGRTAGALRCSPANSADERSAGGYKLASASNPGRGAVETLKLPSEGRGNSTGWPCHLQAPPHVSLEVARSLPLPAGGCEPYAPVEQLTLQVFTLEFPLGCSACSMRSRWMHLRVAPLVDCADHHPLAGTLVVAHCSAPVGARVTTSLPVPALCVY